MLLSDGSVTRHLQHLSRMPVNVVSAEMCHTTCTITQTAPLYVSLVPLRTCLLQHASMVDASTSKRKGGHATLACAASHMHMACMQQLGKS
jgi:hypothetical protein